MRREQASPAMSQQARKLTLTDGHISRKMSITLCGNWRRVLT
jgi:hypothetical protein